MKVLFVHSGNSTRFPVSPFLASQAASLREKGVEVEYFPVVGKGFGYLKNIGPLRRKIRTEVPDVIHAHYSLCGWVAVLAGGGRPIVLSLMGDDAQGTFLANGRRALKSWFFVVLTWLVQPFVDAIIYKSKNLLGAIWRNRIAHWIPNGIRLDQFKLHETDLRGEMGLDTHRKHVLFLGDPDDPNKNIALARTAIEHLGRSDVEFHAIHGIPHDMVVKYLNCVDVFVLCSFGEGSPNVIKEAMTCNCPIVTTPAGDAPWVLGETPGCLVASYEPIDFASKIELALGHDGRTKGRERILALGLDAGSIADQLVALYQRVIKA